MVGSLFEKIQKNIFLYVFRRIKFPGRKIFLIDFEIKQNKSHVDTYKSHTDIKIQTLKKFVSYTT